MAILDGFLVAWSHTGKGRHHDLTQRKEQSLRGFMHALLAVLPQHGGLARPMVRTAPARAVILFAVLLAAGLLAWQLSGMLLLAFASVLFAIVLRSFADLFETFTPIPSPWSLALAGLLLFVGGAAFIAFLGAQIHAQLAALFDNLPETLDNLGGRIGVNNLQQRIADQFDRLDTNGLAGSIAGYTFGALDTLTTLLVVIVSGVYLAIDPATYIKGALKLVPAAVRDRLDRALNLSGRALQRWLLGQLCSMAFVGVATTVGLYLIGMPSPMALGLLAGLAEFVPLVGPLVASVPAILLALAQDDHMVVWVILLYLVIQQVDGNIVLPLIQRRTVKLPPALMLMSILAAGALFGVLGVILAVPMAVLLYVLVKQLYIRDTLGEETQMPGEPKSASRSR